MFWTRKTSPEDCGCAPTEAERAQFMPPLSRRGAIGVGIVGLAALGTGVVAGVAPAAFAASYPSWDDVQRAKNNEAAKAGEISRIEGLIAQLTDNVNRTQAEAQRLAGEFFVAQEAFFDAAQQADDLQAQADQQAADALDAANKAGKVAAQLYRNGGDDTAMELFFAGSAAGADDLLARLGSMDKLVQRNGKVYAAAIAARDNAQALSDQAVVAREERDRLKAIAEDAMLRAQDAAVAAQAALDQQTSHLRERQAQLAALKDTTASTVKGYQDGVEAARKAKEEADRLAREQAEKDKENGGGGGGGGGGGPLLRAPHLRIRPALLAVRPQLLRERVPPRRRHGRRLRRRHLRGLGRRGHHGVPLQRVRQLRPHRPRRRHPDQLCAHEPDLRARRPAGRRGRDGRRRGGDRQLVRLPPALRGLRQRRRRRPPAVHARTRDLGLAEASGALARAPSARAAHAKRAGPEGSRPVAIASEGAPQCPAAAWRSMASTIRRSASAAFAHASTLTHLPGSRSL